VNAELRLTRVFGTLKPYNPNLLAGFLVPCMASAWGLSVLALAKRQWVPALVVFGAALLITLGLVMTGSRGGYLALVVVLLTLFGGIGHLLWQAPSTTTPQALMQRKSLKRLWAVTLLGGVLVGVLAIVGLPSLRHRVESIVAMREDSSTSFRLNVYHSAWRMFLDNWLVGIGPGNNTFKLVYGLYMIPGYTALSAYSVPLEIAVEQGIVGLLAFALLLVVLLFRGVAVLDNTQTASTSHKLMVLLLGAGIAGLLVYGLFDTIWYRPAVNIPFWFMVAGYVYFTEPDDRSPAQTLP
jgi:putative inorganic carbon (hco3(-)) transporter